MDYPIISHARIRLMAQQAHARGDARDSCVMPPDSPARHTWLLEWDRCEAQKKYVPAARACIDLRQGAA